MIVDLVRNDLGRIAVTSTVTVPGCCGFVPARGVASGVDGDTGCPAAVSTRRCSAACFPPASVTELETAGPAASLQWEPDRRGIYYLRYRGFGIAGRGAELNVAIRTVEFDAPAARSSVSGVGGTRTPRWAECPGSAAIVRGGPARSGLQGKRHRRSIRWAAIGS